MVHKKERSVAMITGASSGIGKELAITLARRGWDLVIGARRTEALEETARLARAEGSSVVAAHLDLADMTSIESFHRQGVAHFPHIDVLVNNAGAATPRKIEDCSPAFLQNIFAVNAIGPLALAQRQINEWKHNDRAGRLVFVSSDHVHTEFPYLLHYGAGKVAMEFVARGLNRELHDTRIQSSVIRVGSTDTEFRASFNIEAARDMVAAWARTGVPSPPRKRLTPAVVAEIMAFAIEAPAEASLDYINLRPAEGH